MACITGGGGAATTGVGVVVDVDGVGADSFGDVVDGALGWDKEVEAVDLDAADVDAAAAPAAAAAAASSPIFVEKIAGCRIPVASCAPSPLLPDRVVVDSTLLRPPFGFVSTAIGVDDVVGISSVLGFGFSFSGSALTTFFSVLLLNMLSRFLFGSLTLLEVVLALVVLTWLADPPKLFPAAARLANDGPPVAGAYTPDAIFSWLGPPADGFGSLLETACEAFRTNLLKILREYSFC